MAMVEHINNVLPVPALSIAVVFHLIIYSSLNYLSVISVPVYAGTIWLRTDVNFGLFVRRRTFKSF